MSNFLAIDQGTTSSRAIVFNSQLNAITDSQKEYSLSYPNDGWVEADPADILNTVRDTVSDVLKKENAITAVIAFSFFRTSLTVSLTVFNISAGSASTQPSFG